MDPPVEPADDSKDMERTVQVMESNDRTDTVDSIDPAEIRAAAARIAGRVRRTPMMALGPAKTVPGHSGPLAMKLECLQVSGSFKPRGALNKLLSLPEGAAARGVITASGGNHGLGVAYAALAAGVPATVYLPQSVSAEKIAKLESWGARVVVEGAYWDLSNAAALAVAARDGLAYIHPFADPAVIAGQGSVGLEILADAPRVDTVLVAIGGGGLIAGVASALKAVRPEIRVVGVEPVGAPTLHECRRLGRLATLDAITSTVVTLAARSTAAINFAIVERTVDDIVLVSDEQMREAARWLWFELGIGVELSGAATLAALMTGAYRPAAGEHVCLIVCGAGSDGLPAAAG
jgi:threonine dehydratase